MTAPTAWLYGIPVERFMDGRGATVANLWLLGIVSLWRVALFSRAVSLIYRVEFSRALGWVLIAAALEAVIVLFFSGFGEAIGRGMAGMRNSAEQDLILKVLGTVFWSCVIAVPILLIVMKAVLNFEGRAELAELPSSRKVPWLALVACAAVWAGVAVVPQQELAKEWKYRAMLERGDTRDALAYLNTLEPEDWPPAKSFRPDPYEYEVYKQLPRLMEQVTGTEKLWVQEKLLWVFEKTFDHWVKRFQESDYLKILNGVEKLERGEEWIRSSQEFWTNRPTNLRNRGWTNLVEYLEAKGVTVETRKAEK
jgi:hypothetical protein